MNTIDDQNTKEDPSPHWIDGKPVASGGDTLIDCPSPVDGLRLYRFKAADPTTVADAFAGARRAFPAWSGLPFEQRAAILQRYADELRQQADATSALISAETGKPRSEALTEVKSMAGKIALSIEAYQRRCAEFAAGSARTRFKPHGILGVLGPYNFPGHLPNGHIVPALLAGNCVVFKPSELTPKTGRHLVELLHLCGLPAGVLQLVQGAAATGQALVSHPELNGLLFTGSARTGEQLALHFARRPGKILALEMGGNNPLIVWEPSHIPTALTQTLQSAFQTAGQRCTCARRLILPAGPSGDRFLELLVQEAEGLHFGPPDADPEPFAGPVIRLEIAQKLLQTQETWQKQGARCLLAMRHLRPATGFLSPGIWEIPPSLQLPDEEYFGPLLQVYRASSFPDALRLANATAYGLAAGLISANPGLYQQFYHTIRAGIINWNQPLTGASGAAPFGGIGRSGNFRPSAFFAADYCAYPVASIEQPPSPTH